MANTKKYTIVAEFQTGDSFSHIDTTTEVTEHDDLDVAKENLRRIKEHYRYYEKHEDQAADRVPKGKEADYGFRPDPHTAVYCLKLKMDNGEDFQLHAPWCGHFERLYAVEIVYNKEVDDMRITF